MIAPRLSSLTRLAAALAAPLVCIVAGVRAAYGLTPEGLNRQSTCTRYLILDTRGSGEPLIGATVCTGPTATV